MQLSLFKLAVFSILGGGLTGLATGPWLVRETFLMGTTLAVSVSTETREGSLEAIDSAFAATRRVDGVINDWRDDTDLARVNRSGPAVEVSASDALRGYLREVAEWSRSTGGAFDPAIGALVDAWDLRGKGRFPSEAALRAALERSGFHRFAFDSITLRRPDAASWIDAGGFGKGAALRAARDALRKFGVRAAILNFGGQIQVLGDTVLMVDVAHPGRRFLPVARLLLHDASASTTSQSEHFVEIEGRRFGHVLDPRTGVPVPAWGSVTVVHSDPMIADILSTALFVMGPEEGLKWADGRGLAALFLVARGDSVAARSSSAMQQILVTQPPIQRGN